MITNHPPRSAIQKLILSFLLLFSFAACGPDKGGDSTNNSAATTDTQPPGPDQKPEQTNYLLGTHLDTLTLDSANYKQLRVKFPPSAANKTKLVVQFHFNKANPRNPSLIAYAARPGNKYRSTTVPNPFSVVLEHGGSALELPSIFVLGDQQIRFEEIDAIIGSETNYVLYFIPVIVPGEINVRYNICIRKGTGSVVCLAPPPATQPSPPADTN